MACGFQNSATGFDLGFYATLTWHLVSAMLLCGIRERYAADPDDAGRMIDATFTLRRIAMNIWCD
jgi:hypothetical protein